MKLAVERLNFAQWQYQPGTTHDPNPPLNLETPAAGAYSITVTSAAVTATGTSVNLKRALRISVSTAAITATGTSVTLKVARSIAVGTAAVTLTGSSVNLKVGRKINATSAAVTITGTSVTLSKTKLITVQSGTVTLTGSVVNLTATQGQAQQPTGGFARPKKGQKRMFWDQVEPEPVRPQSPPQITPRPQERPPEEEQQDYRDAYEWAFQDIPQTPFLQPYDSRNYLPEPQPILPLTIERGVLNVARDALQAREQEAARIRALKTADEQFLEEMLLAS